jgi:hypothetical protein
MFAGLILRPTFAFFFLKSPGCVFGFTSLALILPIVERFSVLKLFLLPRRDAYSYTLLRQIQEIEHYITSIHFIIPFFRCSSPKLFVAIQYIVPILTSLHFRGF